MLKLRKAISEAGPDTSGCWYDAGEPLEIAAFTASVTASEFPICIIQRPALLVAGGFAQIDTLSTAGFIQTLLGCKVVIPAGLAAQSTLTLGVQVRRAGVVLGTDIVLGWKSSGTGTPTATAWVPLDMPFNAANTAAVVTNAVGSWCLLQPNDVLTLVATTASATVAVPALAVSTSVH